MAEGQRREVLLDDDTLIAIFRLLLPRSLARCAAVCSQWHRLVTSQLMKDACSRHGGLVYSDPSRCKEAMIRTEQFDRLLKCNPRVLSSQAHSGRVNCCHWSMDTLATGSSDNTVSVWSMDSMQCMEEYRVPDSVAAVKFDGSRIFAAAGKDVHIWKRGNRETLRVLGGHNQRLHSMHCIDPELAVGCADGTVRIFDMYTARCSMLLRHHTEKVTCIRSLNKPNVLVSGSYDCSVRLWDPLSGENVRSYFPASSAGISCLHVGKDRIELIVGTVLGDIDCFDIRVGGRRPLWSRRSGNGPINSIHWPTYTLDNSCMIKAILIGGNDGKLHLINSDTGRTFRTFTRESHSSPVLSARLGHTRFVSCHADGTVTRWIFDQGRTRVGLAICQAY
ncbi:F-box/WD-40 repeat-containing protein At3g52030 isoform X1 [Selaginella moellendorffii]|uniref:F-box/WD-40 repeat-containing protein At3g52030 isoform X1 n=1 Tax=Selaginella moellendorffii TaxID=88036 RepID=UPI000D1C8711|nr:F-box/WD-40 repeat-containing protein At3g52030 isoform X1 [Selaginella moellendorffii]XP_024538237.1 F-box/WD-40 repeat-containing protein At3g52030 isoform X1 [Selaginella moellendorffii]|eukprot:XP_024538236.1 F-box/WD-40 repeat-containing protein At3g52030 isoform X1 [Selaginella moellendorffii]